MNVITYPPPPSDGFCDRDLNTQDCGVYVRCWGRLRVVTPDLLECCDCYAKYVEPSGAPAGGGAEGKTP